MSGLPVPLKTISPKVRKFAIKITDAWQSAVDGILSVSHLLKDAEDQLSDAELLDLHGELPFSRSTAEKLLSIALDTRLNNPSNKQHLPPHWTTLYEMTRLDDETFEEGLASGLINPNVERKHILELTGQTLVVAQVAVQKTQKTIEKTQDTAKLATISIPKGFNISKVGLFQKEIEELVQKYGGELKFDKTKKGVIGRQRQAIADECTERMEKRKQEYGKITRAELELLESTLSQLKRDRSGKPLLPYKKDSKTGQFHKNDIKHPKHPYHGWNLKDVYDYIRKEKILTKHSGLKEIDKEAHCLNLLRQHCLGNARSRHDAIVKLTRLVNRGDAKTKRFAQNALDKMIID